MSGKDRDKEKKQLLLRLSPSLWQEVAAWAEDDFRSINGQIEYLLTECVRRRKKTATGADAAPGKAAGDGATGMAAEGIDKADGVDGADAD